MKIDLNLESLRKRLALSIGFLGLVVGLTAPLQAQQLPTPPTPQYTRPSWWFGLAGAANVNFYGGSTQRINADIEAPMAFHQGLGVGLYAAPLVEFHRPGSVLGLMFQAGYDSKRGTYNQEFSPCNCPRDLATKVSYVTVEPSIRIAPFRGNFFVYVGPRAGYNVRKSFIYKQGTNPAYPEQPKIADETGDLSNMKPWIFSGQVGMGYDIQLSKPIHQVQWVLTPFVAYQPYFGQEPRTIETWTVQTLRGGFALKLGRGRLIPAEVVRELPPSVPERADPTVRFSTHAPLNVPSEGQVTEVFPLSNYVFFDLGSTAIPSRYVLLRKDQVQNFEADKVELYTPSNLEGRSGRQMTVYYNILNILGDRMVDNPHTTVRLVGSSREGNADGLAMANSVKQYLVDVFGISGTRIAVEGRDKPKVPTGPTGGTVDVELLREGNRRVTIETDSPMLLQEFQSGPEAMSAAEAAAIQTAPKASYVEFDNAGSDTTFTSWRLELKDQAGNVQKFGPYTQEKASLSSASILGTQPEGDYVVTMIGTRPNGIEVKKFSNMHVVLWTPPTTQEVKRFSVVYEFDKSRASADYEKYLLDVVIPKIPVGGRVKIHGYADVIGYEDYNQTLSTARANDVKAILERGLAKAGRRDVTMEVAGLGEDPNLSQFNNKYPEERFYNRAVLVDISPGE